MRNVELVLGALLILAFQLLGCEAAAHKRFRDMFTGRSSTHARGHKRHHGRLQGWSPDASNWNEELYPAWKPNDARWKNCWKGGKVVLHLTSDSPALVGSNVTFVASLQFPRCQKEDENGDIIYAGNCTNGSDSSAHSGKYVYNWTSWPEDYGWRNCTDITTCDVFPDGRPFPHHSDWRKNFVYIFNTLGQYHQETGRSFATFSLNTTNITLGNQQIDVVVYHRRWHRKYVPIATASTIYVITDTIPFTVNISQKNDRNASDHRFIKDMPVSFAVKLHDPSNYLKNANISYKWNFSDGTGLFVSNSSVANHTYTLLGNYSAVLTVEAILPVPAPCGPVTPTPFVTTEGTGTTEIPTTPFNTTTSVTTGAVTSPPNSTTSAPGVADAVQLVNGQAPVEGCLLHRYGYFNTTLTIVDGILELSILPMTRTIEEATSQSNAVVDFVVTCQGSIPTEACTIILDSTCMVPQNAVCDQVVVMDQCQLTIQRTFNRSGTYCVNITLGDDASLALGSTMVSIGEATSGSATTLEAFLIFGAFLVLLAAVGMALLYKRYKKYTPVQRNVHHGSGQFHEGMSIYFSRVKAAFFSGNEEKSPLLKDKAGVI